MQNLMLLMAILVSNTVIAATSDVEVKCWSHGKEVFHRYMEDVFYTEHAIGAVDNKDTYFLFADCIVKYKNKHLKKEA